VLTVLAAAGVLHEGQHSTAVQYSTVQHSCTKKVVLVTEWLSGLIRCEMQHRVENHAALETVQLCMGGCCKPFGGTLHIFVVC
jgi:hypothetical protein